VSDSLLISEFQLLTRPRSQ